MSQCKRPRETKLPYKLNDKAWEDQPAKKQRLKVVCVETNKTHEVMSSSLETDDRDYVTEDDLTTGNVLIWVKNKKRLTVRVAEKGEAPKKTYLEDSASGSEEEENAKKKSGTKGEEKGGKEKRVLYGFSQEAQPWSKQTVDAFESIDDTQMSQEQESQKNNGKKSDTLTSVPSQSVGFSQRVTTDENFENMETQMPQEQSHESTLACQPEQDKGKNSNNSSDELRQIRIAVEGILAHLIANQSNRGIGGPTLNEHPGSPAPLQPPGPSCVASSSHPPDYFLTESGVNLLNLKGVDSSKYALSLLDALYSEEELKTSSMKLLEDCLRKKFGDEDFKENSGSIRASCSQKCRDRGKSKAKKEQMQDQFVGWMLYHAQDQGGKEARSWPRSRGQGSKIMAKIWGQGGKIMAKIWGQGGKIIAKI
ncbi:hypothetical protein EMCRGX_G010093 [Ephydatia muelleri]